MLAFRRQEATIKARPVAAIPSMGGGERFARGNLTENQNITDKTPGDHETKRDFS
jgi:hypothetical protein